MLFKKWFGSVFARPVLLVSACLALSYGCQRKAPASFERPPAPVETAAAVARDVPLYLDAVGKIAAREVVTIQPQISGRITQIHFSDGAEVKAGQILFTIDPRPFQAQLKAAEANLAQAKANLEMANINFTRLESVGDARAVSRQDYDVKKNAVQVADAQVRQQQAALDSARLNLDYTTIAAPINGRTGQRMVDVGNVVSANASALLVIQRMDPIYADFTVTEKDLGTVQRNFGRGGLTVEVRLPDDPSEPRSGKLTFLDSAVQEGTGTVKLRATLENRDRRFWPGRFANVRLVLGTQPQAILIPAEAPQLAAKGPFVYVVKSDATAELRPVALGQRQGDLVVIANGLGAGERVVVKGQLGVTPGGKVNLNASKPTTVPPAEKKS